MEEQHNDLALVHHAMPVAVAAVAVPAADDTLVDSDAVADTDGLEEAPAVVADADSDVHADVHADAAVDAAVDAVVVAVDVQEDVGEQHHTEHPFVC